MQPENICEISEKSEPEVNHDENAPGQTKSTGWPIGVRLQCHRRLHYKALK